MTRTSSAGGSTRGPRRTAAGPGCSRPALREAGKPGAAPRRSPAMSRLEFHIAQKVAQRDAIDRAAERLAGLDGVIVEFGLGHGRSYSHLVARFPGHEVFCFDR